jgi:hypothetical protein
MPGIIAGILDIWLIGIPPDIPIAPIIEGRSSIIILDILKLL